MRAGIGLGSNLGDRLANLQRGWREVLALPGVSGPSRHSHVFETEPVGAEPGAGAFLNAVGEVEFEGHPIALLEGLQEIERRMGRPSKRPRNSSRPIDLDLLYAGNVSLANEEIVIPHPRLHQRGFVLRPLVEIRPELILAGREQSIADLTAALPPAPRVELCENLSLT